MIGAGEFSFGRVAPSGIRDRGKDNPSFGDPTSTKMKTARADDGTIMVVVVSICGKYLLTLALFYSIRRPIFDANGLNVMTLPLWVYLRN